MHLLASFLGKANFVQHSFTYILASLLSTKSRAVNHSAAVAFCLWMIITGRLINFQQHYLCYCQCLILCHCSECRLKM